MCIYVLVCMYATYMQQLWRLEEGREFSNTRLAKGCKPSEVGAGNKTQVSWKSKIYYSLNHLSNLTAWRKLGLLESHRIKVTVGTFVSFLILEEKAEIFR